MPRNVFYRHLLCFVFFGIVWVSCHDMTCRPSQPISTKFPPPPESSGANCPHDTSSHTLPTPRKCLNPSRTMNPQPHSIREVAKLQVPQRGIQSQRRLSESQIPSSSLDTFTLVTKTVPPKPGNFQTMDPHSCSPKTRAVLGKRTVDDNLQPQARTGQSKDGY